ncbi:MULTISPECIES: hypothetical protein [Listeria]|uniref:hypothetical protein n=1 Tax=Listeria TaxID=1637 RepID=UPI000B59639E|nr:MULTISPECIES: hypothetical protein [Listeria]
MKKLVLKVFIASMLTVGIIGTFGFSTGDKAEAAFNQTNSSSGQYGFVDELRQTNWSIKTSGWHGNRSGYPSYAYIFIMNRDTGLELGRYKIARSYRPDVTTAYGNSVIGWGGFGLEVGKSKFRGKRIYIMSRYTSDPNGNRGVLWADRYYNETWINVW